MRRLELPRLTQSEITALSGAMLGKEGRNPRFLHMLEQATEGNMSFIIDVIRTLASEYNTLTNITHVTIPDVLISRSMIEVAHRRLRHVAAEYQPMLRVAAVLRRTVDLELLRVIDDTVDTLEWVQACVNAAILELHKGQWRFTHDKLRDAILSQLPLDEQRQLHLLAARAIETLYPNDPAYYDDLYHHYRELGDVQKQALYRKKQPV
jgi:predicted ATPase